ncbi:MAG: helix-turn-helix transcriptional regulator, partial [Gaiellaceae bacterium]
GDLDAAHVAVEQALAAHERLPQPFELARTMLVLGTVERRARRWRAAREALARALEIFDHLGASLWAEKAGAELARVAGRAPGRSGLSETEERVAGLVAGGLSNKQVAAELFVTVRTVEANLTRIYAKLGVRSRTELAHRFSQS